jgi:hypothetical protein
MPASNVESGFPEPSRSKNFPIVPRSARNDLRGRTPVFGRVQLQLRNEFQFSTHRFDKPRL